MLAATQRDRAVLAFVLLVWAGMIAWAVVYVLAYGPPFPFGDESHLWNLLPPSGRLDWSTLWEPKNEHRIPLPRLLHYLAYRATGDLRTPLVVDVAILGAAAFVWIAAARRWRGRSSIADTMFPLLFLHVGNSANLLSGFQVALMLPVSLTAAILAAIAVSPAQPGLRRALPMAACLALLPLCGAVGIVQLPALAAWTAIAGWKGRRSADAGERLGGLVLLAAVAFVLAIAAVELAEYARPHWYTYSRDPAAALALASAIAAQSFGPAGTIAWPAAAAALLGLAAATLVLLVRSSAGDPSERLRRLGFLASFAGTACLLVAVGIGRSDATSPSSFVPRYHTLAISLPLWAYASWTLYGGKTGRAIVCGGLALAAWAAVPSNARAGIREGRDVVERVERFRRIVDRGASVDELIRSYTDLFPFHYFARSQWILQVLAVRRDPPFDRGRAPDAEAFDFPSFSRPPSHVESDRATPIRWIDGEGTVLVHGGTRIRFDLRAGERRIAGRCGLPVEISGRRKLQRVRVVVEAISNDGGTTSLFERTLAQAGGEEEVDRSEFAVDALPEGAVEVVLRTEGLEPETPVGPWSYWSGVRIE